MATGGGRAKGYGEGKTSEMSTQEDSSESEGETEPAKAFHRRISTNREIKTTKCIKEGYLMKQAGSFNRWKRKYFKLRGRKLYYAKDSKSVIYDEIDLTDLSLAECSTKNVNHSFQVITPFRNLVVCADARKEMEEWIAALKSASNREFYDPNVVHREMMSGQHNWYASSHARPTYCNVCREALSGVTSHGLSCEVCKFKAHKRCAIRAANNCKWTTLSSIGKDIVEEDDGSLHMPHQWMEGNLPVSAKCAACDRTCGSVLRLQDWRCLWCKAMVHSSCKKQYSPHCSLGQFRISILPSTSINNLDSDGFWEASKPLGTSPLLVFINSKSGDNQGVKMLRRLKQLLNPAQVFDLINGGPQIGLRLFQKFDLFRILVCGGDGSISWVLGEIDRLGIHKQCHIGVLPLGTGNDLARVLGWGAAFDDDGNLPVVIEQLEHAQIKMLDRWSLLTYEGSMPPPRKLSQQFDPISTYEDSVAVHLSKILNSDSHSTVIASAKVLCETVKDFVAKVGEDTANDAESEQEDSITRKCSVLNEKLDALLTALNNECQATTSPQVMPNTFIEDDESSHTSETDTVPEGITKPPKNTKSAILRPKDHLMSRANSLKKAVRQIIEHTEKALDEQNAQTLEQQMAAPSTSILVTEVDIMTPSGDEADNEDEGEKMDNQPENNKDFSETNRDLLTIPGSSSDEAGSAATTPGSLTPTGDRSPSPYADMPFFPNPTKSSPKASRRISAMAMTRSPVRAFKYRDKSPTKEGSPTFPIVNMPVFPIIPKSVKRAIALAEIAKHERSSGPVGGLAGGLAGGSFISKVLLANADALCAAASPLMEEEIDLTEYTEKCVMNNYFGIGLDAKISLEFHNKREEHPEKCRSRTKNMVWYGVLGSKEMVHQTYKNLDQRVQLECDGQRIPLPNLQGIVILNIASYMGGINFWGGNKENDIFAAPSMDDKILEVVAVFGSAQLGISRVINLQHHRIAQCRSVKISIIGDEGVPVQVDGEAWIQPPGYIHMVHKNRAQMLTRDKEFEEALKTWTERQKLERPVSHRPNHLSEEETQILQSFVDATQVLIKNVKMACICHSIVEQDLAHLATQASAFLDRLYPAGKLAQPAIRTQVSDLVSSVRTLYRETNLFMADKVTAIHLNPDLVEQLLSSLSLVEGEMKKVYEIGGLPHFQAVEDEVAMEFHKRRKERSKFRLMARLKHRKKERQERYSGPSVLMAPDWTVEEVGLWLGTLGLVDYREKFMSHDIMGKELLNLGRQDLKDLGVSKIGHIKRIQHGIKDIKLRLAAHEKEISSVPSI